MLSRHLPHWEITTQFHTFVPEIKVAQDLKCCCASWRSDCKSQMIWIESSNRSLFERNIIQNFLQPLSPAWLCLIGWNIFIDARTKKNARFLVTLNPISEVTHVQMSPNIWMSLIHVNARGQVSSWQGCDGTEFTVFTVPLLSHGWVRWTEQN